MKSREFIPYLNIETLVEGTPDQGLYTKKGGLGVPDLLFTDFNGTVLHRIMWDQYNEETFAAAQEEAERRFNIYLELSNSPEDARAAANAKLLDLLLERNVRPLDELRDAAKVEGVESFLLEHFATYSRRKPILDVVEKFNRASKAAVRDECHAEALALYEAGVRVDDWKDAQLFIPYWRMAFEGALLAKKRAVAARVLADFESFSDRKSSIKVIAKMMREDLDALPRE